MVTSWFRSLEPHSDDGYQLPAINHKQQMRNRVSAQRTRKCILQKKTLHFRFLKMCFQTDFFLCMRCANSVRWLHFRKKRNMQHVYWLHNLQHNICRQCIEYNKISLIQQIQYLINLHILINHKVIIPQLMDVNDNVWCC